VDAHKSTPFGTRIHADERGYGNGCSFSYIANTKGQKTAIIKTFLLACLSSLSRYL
jgi:hypothetical protein